MMKKLLTTAVCFLVAGCASQKSSDTPATTPPAPEAAESPAAAATAIGATAAKPEPAALPKPLSADDKVKLFQGCWAAFNAKDWAKFAPCYAENASSEDVDSGQPKYVGRNDIVEKGAKMFALQAPDVSGEAQLILVNGEHVAAVLLLAGTNTGPLLGPGGAAMPATNKKFGVLIAQAGELDASGPVIDDRLYMDAGSFLGQLGLNPGPHRPLLEPSATKEVVLASGSDEEKANLALVARNFELFNQHDAKGLVGIMTDVVFSDGAAPADVVGKKAVKKAFDDLFQGFHDVKLSIDKSWAAGKYVVSEGSFSGTNDGNMPSMKLKKTGKRVSVRVLELDEVSNGKLARQHIFDNGLAFAMQLGLLPPPGAPDNKKEAPKKDAAKPKS
jgi:predicted ester cyclase